MMRVFPFVVVLVAIVALGVGVSILDIRMKRAECESVGGTYLIRSEACVLR